MELWPFMPQVGIVESLEWLTDIIPCKAAEYRSALRLTPRQEQQLLFHLNDQQYSRAKSLAKLLMGDDFYLPNWPSLSEVTAIDPGNVVVTSTYGKGFLEDDKCLLWESDTSFQVLTIASVSSTGVTVDETLSSTSTSAWETGSALSGMSYPIGVDISPDGTRALIANTAAAVRPLTLSGGTWSVGASISVGGGPAGVSISPDGAKALVANSSDNTVTPLTLSAGTWTAGTAISVGSSPYGVVISPDGINALVANVGSNKVTPLTLSAGTWTAGTPITVGGSPYALAISPDGTKALVANYGSNNVTPLTLSAGTWTAGTVVSVGTNPRGVAISPDGTKALVANYGSNNVTPLTLSAGTWTAGTVVSVGTSPSAVAFANGTSALVTNYGSNNVTPLTLSAGTWTAGTVVSVGTNPRGVAISPTGERALVTNYTGFNVTPLQYTTQVTSVINAVLVPLRVVSFAQEFSANRSNFAVTECTGRFVTTVTEDLSALSGISYPTFLGHPVVTDKSFFSGGQREEYLRLVEEMDTRSGIIWREPVTNIPLQRGTWSWSPLNASEMWDLRIWLHQRYGKQKAFWVPSWSGDVSVVENIGSSDTLIYISDINYRTTNPGNSYLMFVLTSGSVYFAKVTDATAGISGQEYLTLSAAAGFTATVGEIDRVCYLTLSRFDSDRVEIVYGFSGSAKVSMPIVEVPVP